MGKQTCVALTPKDEIEFLGFLRSTGQVKIFCPLAPAPESLEITDFLPVEDGHWQFFIWPTAFSWQPNIGRVSNDAPAVERRGFYYLQCDGPLLEYSRHSFEHEQSHGRVYWARTFVKPLIEYDEQAFDRWYQKVVRWLRKNGKRKTNEAYSTYYLPDAWEKHASTERCGQSR